MRLIYVTFSLDLNFGSGSSSARIKWCSLLSAVLLLMKSIMPSLKPPKLCNLLLIMVVLYYLVFFRQLLFYICFGILFQLLHGDDELLITDMPKEDVERYHLYLEDLFFSSCFGEDSSERLKLYPSLSCLSCITVVTVSKCFWSGYHCSLFGAYEDSDFTRTGSRNGLWLKLLPAW